MLPQNRQKPVFEIVSFLHARQQTQDKIHPKEWLPPGTHPHFIHEACLELCKIPDMIAFIRVQKHMWI